MSESQERMEEDRFEEICSKYDLHVQKVGGSAIEELDFVIEHLEKQQERFGQQIIAVSAIRSTDEEYEKMKHPDVIQEKDGFNTTDHLILVAQKIKEGRMSEAVDIVESYIQVFLKDVISKKVTDSTKIATINEIIETRLQSFVDKIKAGQAGGSQVEQFGTDFLFANKETGESFSFIKEGEDISADIFKEVLSVEGKKVVSLELTEEEEDQILQEFDMELVAKDLKERMRLEKRLEVLFLAKLERQEDADFIITSGYKPGLATQRGFTDTSASLIFKLLKKKNKKVLLYKQQEISMMSAYPKDVPEAKVLDTLECDTFGELVGDRGAQNEVLTKDAFRLFEDAGGPMLVYNPRNLEDITLVSKERKENPGQVDLIEARKTTPTCFDITASSTYMNEEGVIKKIAQACERVEMSILHMGTGTKKVSLVLNERLEDEKKIEELKVAILEELDDESVTCEEKDTENSHMLFCKGDNMGQPGILSQVSTALMLVKANIRFVTQPDGRGSMVFVIDCEDIKLAKKMVHKLAVETDLVDFRSKIEETFGDELSAVLLSHSKTTDKAE